VKTLRSQKLRMLLTHRKLLQSKAIAVENDLRASLRNFGLKVGVVATRRFEAHIKELVETFCIAACWPSSETTRCAGDPYCAAKCSNCGTEWPETRVEGIGPGSMKCVKCGAEATPFTFTNGYTIVFDQAKSIGVIAKPFPTGCLQEMLMPLPFREKLTMLIAATDHCPAA
jgi:hypothetical protein